MRRLNVQIIVNLTVLSIFSNLNTILQFKTVKKLQIVAQVTSAIIRTVTHIRMLVLRYRTGTANDFQLPLVPLVYLAAKVACFAQN